MKTILSFLIIFHIPLLSFSQSLERDDVVGEIQKNNKMEISFYKTLDKEKAYSKQTDFFENILKVSKNNEFKLFKRGEEKENKSFEEYNQYFKGVEVKSGVFILHWNNDFIESANGNYIRIDELNIEPTITKEDAMMNWCNYLKIPIEEVRTFKSQLMVVDLNENNENVSQSQVALVYKIRLYSRHQANILIGYINAHSGDICLTESLAITSSASNSTTNLKVNMNVLPTIAPLPVSTTGTFATRYSDSQTATTESRNSLFFLEDLTRGDGIETLNLENTNAADTTGALSFSADDNNWTADDFNGDYGNAPLDVHWALQNVYEYFQDEHSRSGWDSTGQKINAYVHAIINGSKDNAAYYNGEYLAFGDGQDTFYPVVSFDAVTHEYAHGINDHTSNFGSTGLVRSFNEGLSDIWAAVIEDYVAPQKSNWEIGEEIMRNDDCLRNIANPNDPGANTEIADTYGTTEYNLNSEAYYRSGIMSHWFYLLSEGDSGTNGLGNNYNVYTLGIDVAADVVYWAQSKRYLNGTTTYELMRTNMINAANNLFGESSIQSLQVANAWYAVGVGTNPGQLTISGPSQVCSSGVTFNISPTISFDAIQWNVGTDLSISSGQGTTSCTIAATGYGSSYVSVTVTANGNSVTLPQKTVYTAIAIPPLYETSGPSSIVLNSTAHYTTDFLPRQASTYGIYYYDWAITSNLQFESSHTYQTDAYIKGITLGLGRVGFYTTNGCGTSTFSSPVRVVSAKSLNIYPNPTSDEITIEIDDETTFEDTSYDIDISDNSTEAEYMVSIYANSGMPVYNKKYSSINEIKINTSGWQKGIYRVMLMIGNEKYAGSFIIE